MQIIPAIDLRNDKAVRLVQGDYDRETVFDDDPAAVARSWEEQGGTRIHLVDLDGAREGRTGQAELAASIARAVSVPVQLGGGVRSLDDITALIDAGIDRVILGTVAVTNPELVAEACERYGDRIAVGLDARDGRVAVRGWTEDSGVDTIELAQRLANAGVRRFIHTDISRDGAMQGVNIDAMQGFAEAVAPIPVIASGGVTTLDDIRALASTDVEAVIIGR
ncbi:MAG: 1-(5-phosphoribosyl)-5-[(5-phosphoribosylamino)methylideneamino]imidazole-4-carboxamide isomerase, partial [Chloroflexi bacterium]|nr:1-(5-phosphoribosyl)-5-[(5-phosphoribosylamino)methylideneamino]imidazole-4-carboxamide isomerase [Chloroflexota bacterium]